MGDGTRGGVGGPAVTSTLVSSLEVDLIDHRRSRLMGPVLLSDEAEEPLDELPIDGTQLGRGKTVAW
jgi:hypothetical protein